jgi:hypothetical protein
VPEDAVFPNGSNTYKLKCKDKSHFGIMFTAVQEYEEELAVESYRGEELREDRSRFDELENARASLARLDPEQLRLLGLTNASVSSMPETPSASDATKPVGAKPMQGDELKQVAEKEQAEERAAKRHKAKRDAEVVEEMDVQKEDEFYELDEVPSIISEEEDYADSDETSSPEGSSEGHSS